MKKFEGYRNKTSIMSNKNNFCFNNNKQSEMTRIFNLHISNQKKKSKQIINKNLWKTSNTMMNICKNIVILNKTMNTDNKCNKDTRISKNKDTRINKNKITINKMNNITNNNNNKRNKSFKSMNQLKNYKEVNKQSKCYK